MPKFTHNLKHQKGATLLELMVGMTIGLLTIMAALGTLLMTSSVATTVKDASFLQQQASFGFRVIGQQLRQAGGRQLNPDSTALSQVDLVPLINAHGVFPVSGTGTSSDAEHTLDVSYQNVDEAIYGAKGAVVTASQLRNCAQDGKGAEDTPILSSRWKFNSAKQTLECGGNEASYVVLEDVNDFKVKYLLGALDDTGAPVYKQGDADEASASRGSVYAVEVCLELQGSERIDTAGASYTKCDGTSAPRNDRLRMVFKNTYHIRNHAWLGS